MDSIADRWVPAFAGTAVERLPIGGLGVSDEKRQLPAESRSAEVDAFLRELRRVPPPPPSGKRGRLIFALDATASREPTWDRACRIQGEMFEATAALGGLDVKLVYYLSLIHI